MEMDVSSALFESACAPGVEPGRFAESFDPSSTCPTRKKSGRTKCCKRESPNDVKVLHHRFARRTSAGWSPERRARQAATTRRLAPWRHSTGPKTEAGKARCAKNAFRHGGRSRAHIQEFQRIRRILRKVDENIRALRLFIRLRDARPRIKYKPRCASPSAQFLKSTSPLRGGQTAEARSVRQFGWGESVWR
jgi:hypothetical protein